MAVWSGRHMPQRASQWMCSSFGPARAEWHGVDSPSVTACHWNSKVNTYDLKMFPTNVVLVLLDILVGVCDIRAHMSVAVAGGKDLAADPANFRIPSRAGEGAHPTSPMLSFVRAKEGIASDRTFSNHFGTVHSQHRRYPVLARLRSKFGSQLLRH